MPDFRYFDPDNDPEQLSEVLARGNDTDGNNIVISDGDELTGDPGSDLGISCTDPVGDAAGGALSLSSGNANGSGDDAGGNVTILAGDGVNNGDGGDITLTPGTAPGTGDDGRVLLTSGGTSYPLTAAGTGPALTTTAQTIIEAINEVDAGGGGGGDLETTLGLGNTTGDNAMIMNGSTSADRTIRGVDGTSPTSVTFRGGDAPSDGSGGFGGDVTLRAGDGDTSGSSGSGGGSVTITAGDGDDSGGGSITITSGTTSDIAGSGDVSIEAPGAYFAGSVNIDANAGGPGGDGAINLTAPFINMSAISGGGFGTELQIDMEIDDTGGTINIGTTNDPTINIGNANMDSVTANRASAGTGDDTSGLILIDRGGTRLGELTGSPIILGPVYYDPNNGQRIRFGSSIFIDGDGTVNTIHGRDATVSKEEVLDKLGSTDATRSLASIGPISETPLTPGSVTIQVVLASAPTAFATVTDDGVGGFPVSSVLPAGGTVTYATGAMTGTTATLASTSQVVAFYLLDNTAGEALTPRGGAGVGTAAGGNLDLQGGEGGATGAGGDVLITGGDGGSTSGASGSVNISPGSVTSGTVGVVQVNSLPLPSVVSQTASIDLTATGTTSLYTVPTGRSFRVLSVIITPTSVSAAGGDAVVSVGTNAATYDNIVGATTLTGLDATSESFVINTGTGLTRNSAAADVITFQVDTADTGTTNTATVELVGYLV